MSNHAFKNRNTAFFLTLINVVLLFRSYTYYVDILILIFLVSKK